MNCKICGAPFIGASPLLGSFIVTPTCRCGKVRSRERIHGCPVCGAKGRNIQMELVNKKYRLSCECGATWVVEE